MATVEPGAVIGGRYQLIRTIGTGGMAKVWLAHDRLLDREVAVKILAERYASDPDFVERFRREASAAAGLSHPNIVTVYDRGETDGSYYIVMEHLPGPDLKEIIRQRGRLAPRQAVDAALQVLAALSAAHRRNVIHRDIKPQNVLVAEDGHLKVTDFGIARAGDDAGVTEVGSVIGTAQYLSPEQARGEEVTGASDCYAAGVLLYEMLTGRVPFDGDKPVAIAMRQINETPTAPRVLVPQIPPQLNEIVMKSLEKRPGSRYRTAEEFSAALMAVRPSLPEPVEDATEVLAALESPATTRIITRSTEPARATTGRTPLPPPPPRRRRGPLIAALIALLLLAGGAAAFFLTDVGRSSNVAIPSVHGQAEAVARATLIAAGFRVRVDQQASSDVPAGSAIGTDPPEGSGASRNSEVVLIVSTGGELAIVPDLVGDSYDDAAATLTRLNFGVKKVVDFSEKPVGTVFDQTPVGNKEARQGDVVTLFVSKGPELVDVPALKLKTRTQAEDLLKAAGLTLGTVTERESSSRPAGTVLDQDPAGGTTAPKGSAVDIVVAKAPVVTTIAMPSVVGNTAASARQKLQGLGFADPIATTVPSPLAAGTVIDQDPPAGRQVDPSRTPVTLTVSGGITQVPTDPGPLPGVP
jgi:beta-lactam-binding protein with PASTA domain